MAPRPPPKVVERAGNHKREVIKAENKKRDPKAGRALWWKLQEKWHEEVFATLDYLDKNQPYRALLNRYFRAVFRNRPPISADASRSAAGLGLPSDRLLLNVLKAIVNTKKSRIAKNNGRTRFMTNGADYETMEMAFLLEKFCAGLDHEQDTHGQMKRQFVDAEVCGTGAVKVYDDEDEVVTEWTDIDQLIADEESCIGGKALELHQRVWLPVDMLLEDYCGKDMFSESQIMKAASDDQAKRSNGSAPDRICLIESWKLPFRKGAKGLHSFSIKTASFAEDWEQSTFPFAFLRSEVTEGFYGEGCAERVNPLSVELNKLLRTSHLSMALCSIPRYNVHDDSEVEDTEINNEVGGITRWSGNIPVTKEVSNSVPPEMWQRIDWLYQMSFRTEGVSEQSAAARKEPGVTAAVAMREQSDLETDRLSILAQDFEWTRVSINELQIEAARRIHQRKKSYKVKYRLEGDGYQEIDFAEVNLKRDQFIMMPFPSSSLPQSPTARAQWIEERVASGMIPLEVGQKLMQMPDIEKEMSIITAAARDIDRTLDRMMRQKAPKDGKPQYLPPEPFQNLALARDRATAKYLHLRLVPGVPQGKLELLRRYAQQAHRMWVKKRKEEAALQAAEAAAQAPPPGAPPGMSVPAEQTAPLMAPAVAA